MILIVTFPDLLGQVATKPALLKETLEPGSVNKYSTSHIAQIVTQLCNVSVIPGTIFQVSVHGEQAGWKYGIRVSKFKVHDEMHVMQAIEFVQMQEDAELWDLLIELVLGNEALTGILYGYVVSKQCDSHD